MTSAPALRRTRDLSEILSASFGVYGNTSLLLKLLLLSTPGITLGLATIAIQDSLPDWLSEFPVFVLGVVESAILGSAAIYALDQIDRGNDVSIMASFAKAWHHVQDLLVASVIAFVIIGAFCITVIGIPWGLARMVRWALSSQSIMIDEQEGDESLAYTAALVAGRGWPTAGVLVAIYLIAYLPVMAVSGLLGLAFSELTSALAGVAVTALLFPFGVTARTLLFYDLKMRKALA